jgi:hypothetical protein
MTKTKGLSPKQMVFQQNKWFWGWKIAYMIWD